MLTGQSGNLNNTNKQHTPPPMAPRMPQAPRPTAPGMPQAPRPTAPRMPQAPRPTAPGMPQAPRPTAPGMPRTPQQADQKGFFTNAVRGMANAITFGALDRDIEREQAQAVRQQQRADQSQINEAQNEARRETEARIRAERDAERSSDRRSMEAIDGIEVVRGRAIWNIQPGEIARRIKESELEEIEKLKGIIVQQGCTALIFANGELVSQISSGAYLFYKSVEEEQAALRKAVEDAEKQLDEAEKRRLAMRRQTDPTFRELGIVGEIGRASRWLGRIIFGEKKVKDKVEHRKIDYAKILARLTQAPVMSAYIVSDRYIPMTFGGVVSADGQIEFTPYKIATVIHDVDVAVSMEMKVDNIIEFSTNYLADRTSVTTSDIFRIVNEAVENQLRASLRGVEYSGSLSADVTDGMKASVRDAVNARLHGICCVQVTSITDSNRDFERFRSVERQLYNSGRELDFMHRTGEFRNRMEVEANSQELNSARNAEELRYALQKLNKDQLLHDDELDEFVGMLESQRRIRQATTAEEELEAMETLRGNRLVKQDELDQLENELAQKKIPRDEVVQIMRIHSQQNVDMESLKAENALSDARIDHDWEREDLERRRSWGIEDEENERRWMREQKEYDIAANRRKQDEDYDFAKMMRQREIDREDHTTARAERLEDERLEYERRRQEKFDDDQFDDNRHRRSIDKLNAMAQMQAKLDAQQQQHEQNIATIHANAQMNRDNNFANMNADQIRAAQLSHLSEEAQVAMAQSYAGDREAQAIKDAARDKEALMQQMLQMQQQSTSAQMEAMMKMAGMIKDTADTVSSSFQNMQQQRIDELNTGRQHAEERLERTQSQAMDNLAQVSTAAANNINAFNGGTPVTPAPQPTQSVSPTPAAEVAVIECQCYNCGHTIRIQAGTPACPDCGAPFQW